MSEDGMMAAMAKGMGGGAQMPAGTPPARAMAGYDLGGAPANRIAFDKVRVTSPSQKTPVGSTG